MTSYAQLAFDQGMTVILPGQSGLSETGSQGEKEVEIDASAFDIDGKLNVD